MKIHMKKSSINDLSITFLELLESDIFLKTPLIGVTTLSECLLVRNNCIDFSMRSIYREKSVTHYALTNITLCFPLKSKARKDNGYITVCFDDYIAKSKKYSGNLELDEEELFKDVALYISDTCEELLGSFNVDYA